MPTDHRRVRRLVAATVLVFAALALAVWQEAGPVVRLDTVVAADLHEATRGEPGAQRALRVVTFFGSSLALYPAVGAAAVLATRRGAPRLGAFALVTTVSGTVLNHVAKAVVDRPRPVFPEPIATAGGASFPSGHAMNAMVGVGAIALVLSGLGCLGARRSRLAAAAVAGALVAAVGFTRLALGVHYLSDVVGGWLLGGAWLALAAAWFRAGAVRAGRGVTPGCRARGCGGPSP